MKTIAEQFVDVARAAVAVSFDARYCIDASGRRFHFPLIRKLEERRNAKGRCTLYVGQFEDGSCVRFTWSEHNGARFRAEAPAALYMIERGES